MTVQHTGVSVRSCYALLRVNTKNLRWIQNVFEISNLVHRFDREPALHQCVETSAQLAAQGVARCREDLLDCPVQPTFFFFVNLEEVEGELLAREHAVCRH